MSNIARHNRPVFTDLHPLVYGSIIALTLWLVLSAWAFFDDNGYTGLLLAVVTGFLFIFVALPAVLWRTWHRHAADGGEQHRPALRDWANGTFATWQGRLSGTEAIVQVLLPIAAVAFGMTAIGLVFAIVANGAV